MREKMFVRGRRRRFVIGRSANLNRIVATITWIVLVSSMFFMPVVTLSSATYSSSVSTGMHKKEDIFGGSFSPREVIAAPDEAFNVSFSICPTKDAPNTAILIIVPPDLVKSVKGEEEWVGNVKKGQTMTLTLSFVTKGDVDTHVKANVASESKKDQSSYFLHVATPNAKFKPEKGAPARTITPDAKVQVELNLESSRALPKLESSPSSPGTFRVYGTWWYWNDETGGWSPGRYMLVEIWDSDTGPDDLLAQGWTDANGYFDITAPNDDVYKGADVYLRYYALGAWDWFTTDSDGNQYWWRYPGSGTIQDDVPDGWVYDAGDQGALDFYQACQAGDAVYAEMQFVYNWVGWYRSRVQVVWPIETWPHSHGDEIHLPATGGWDHITVQHEQGHCVMWALYGYFPPGPGPTTERHYLASESSGGFAFTEGWAEFMQAAVDNNPNNCESGLMNIENNTWYNGPFWTPEGWIGDSGDMDGDIIEGSVASIFWDIFDGTWAAERDYLDTMNNGGFDEIFQVLMYYNPNDILQFWDDWQTISSDLSTRVGPLCNIYWNYGIMEDYYDPWGAVDINMGDTYTSSRQVRLLVDAYDWGGGVYAVRFADDYPTLTWSNWYTFPTSNGPGEYWFWIDDPGDGLKDIHVQLMDNALRTSAAGGIYDSIYLDTTPPTGYVVINSGNPIYTTSTSVTLYLTYSDSLGVRDVYYGNAGEAWVGPFSPTATMAWTLPSGDGTKTVWYLIYDFAGNSYMCSDSIFLDTTNPTGSIIINSGNPAYTASTAVTLYLTYDDNVGLTGVYYGNAGEAWVGPFSPTPTKAWTLPSGDGTKTVYYRIYDYAGNSYTCSDSIILDTRVLTITASAGSYGSISPSGSVQVNYGQDITFTITPDTGYEILDVVVDGASQGAIPSYTFYAVFVDHSISALFGVNNHDTAVIAVTPSSTIVGQGYPLLIDVTAENHGAYTESFNVTVYYGNSVITAEQWETFWSRGDVNRDGYINGTDLNLITAAWLATPSSGNWNPWADLDQNLIIDLYDLTICSYYQGLEIWTYAITGGVIGTLPVMNLAAGYTQELTFTWDTSGIPYGNYVVCAYAVPILGKEEDRVDNTFADGTVLVTVPVDDVAVVDVTPSRTSVGQSYPLLIDVTVENHGTFTESFNLTVYYGNSAITAQQWETFWSKGDVNRDGYINGTDLNLMTAAYGATPSSPRWNPWADLNQNLIVDGSDVTICSYFQGLEIWTYAISGGVIGTLPVMNLAAGNARELTFTWDTSGIPYGNYVIGAYAVPILGTEPPLGREVDRADNTLADGTIFVTIPGDITGPENPVGSGLYPPDGTVDNYDLSYLREKYGTNDPIADFTGPLDIPDGIVDAYDLTALGKNFGRNIYTLSSSRAVLTKVYSPGSLCTNPPSLVNGLVFAVGMSISNYLRIGTDKRVSAWCANPKKRLGKRVLNLRTVKYR